MTADGKKSGKTKAGGKAIGLTVREQNAVT